MNLVGTTGAGDCAVAGFIAGVVRGQRPEEALTSAVAAGGANVERADASSGVPAWADLQSRIAAGWQKLPLRLPLPGWRFQAAQGLWVAPDDPLYAALPDTVPDTLPAPSPATAPENAGPSPRPTV